jgi:hypothetical protein
MPNAEDLMKKHWKKPTFWILDIDYKNYLFTYQCTQVVNGQKISKG